MTAIFIAVLLIVVIVLGAWIAQERDERSQLDVTRRNMARTIEMAEQQRTNAVAERDREARLRAALAKDRDDLQRQLDTTHAQVLELRRGFEGLTAKGFGAVLEAVYPTDIRDE